uniref:Spermatogenesis associated protein 6 n=1 Tax=Echinococcus granulosus TaxID=6210 RepID=A0A068WGE7_ECHGR|nr:Spermatogenesis associated protein 6 [Echinococcus granulosus]
MTEYFNSGKLLAYFDGNARDFFMPCPTLCSTIGNDRELLMIRTVDFPGVSPRVEFTTTTKISPGAYCPEKMIHKTKSSDTKRSWIKSNISLGIPHYTQPTLNSILKTTSSRQRPLKKIRTTRSMSGNREYASQRLCSPLRNSLNLPLSREEKEMPCTRCSSDCVCAMRRTKSYSSLHDIDLKAAQERSERYWQLYRFWQREVDNLRRSRG